MKYYLHYVGSQLYPQDVFIKEAKEIGVNRSLPLRLIKKLKWQDMILLGSFVPNPSYVPNEICPKCQTVLEDIEIENLEIDLEKKGMVYGCPTCQVEVPKDKAITEKLDKRKNKKGGTANVFGYFQVNGINIQASDEFKHVLMSQLDIVSTNDNQTKVQRQCGHYTIGTSNVIKNSIEDIVDKAFTLSSEKGEKVKFFISGQFSELKASIHPVNFSRSIVEVDIDDTLLPEEATLNVNFIYDYDKRRYIKKYAKRGRPRKEK